MEWDNPPPNPLQHTNIKMTLAKYATKGVDEMWEAKRRCVEKYSGDPMLRKEWMDDWLEIIEANKSTNKKKRR